jgi:hypothetical protein
MIFSADHFNAAFDSVLAAAAPVLATAACTDRPGMLAFLAFGAAFPAQTERVSQRFREWADSDFSSPNKIREQAFRDQLARDKPQIANWLSDSAADAQKMAQGFLDMRRAELVAADTLLLWGDIDAAAISREERYREKIRAEVLLSDSLSERTPPESATAVVVAGFTIDPETEQVTPAEGDALLHGIAFRIAGEEGAPVAFVESETEAAQVAESYAESRGLNFGDSLRRNR